MFQKNPSIKKIQDIHIAKIAHRCGNASKSNVGFICSCPVSSHGKGCGDKNPSLSIAEDRGKLLLKCHAGCSFEEILKALMGMGLMPDSLNDQYRVSNSTIAQTSSAVGFELAPQSAPIKALSIWNNSKDATDTLVTNYLCSRNLTITPPETIRFHPNLKYSVQDNNGVWHESWHPAMLAQIQRYPNDSCIGVHRTYLKPDGSGKAEVLKPKKMLGSCLGGAVRFQGESLECIAVGEGIESCLSYLQFHPLLTVWACLSSGGLKNIILPPPAVTHEVIILVDHDSTGEKAGTKLAERLTKEGRKVFLIMPSTNGWDMNDLLKGEGA